MLLTTGERVSAALLTMALADLGIEAVSFTGQPGRHHHRHRPRQGQDRRGQGRPGARGPRRRQGRRRRRLPGREHRQGDHDDGPRGVRPHRLGAGQGARRRRLRDLHRRHRRVLRRPAHRAPGPQAAPDQLRRDARDGRRRARRCSPCARSSSPATTASPCTCGRRSRGSRARGSPTTATTATRERAMEDPIISGVVTDSSESKVTVLGVPDRPGISAALFEPLADANVNVDMIVQNTSTERHDRHQLHGAVGRHGRRRGHRQPRRRRDRRRRRDPRSGHRQGVGRRRRHEVGARASPPRCSARWPTRTSTSR